MRSDLDRLNDIIEAMERISRYTVRGRAAFDESELIQTWVIHHIEVIGEACRAMTSSLRDGNPDVPWGQIIALRNILAHEYFGVDASLVWESATGDMLSLREKVIRLRDLLKES